MTSQDDCLEQVTTVREVADRYGINQETVNEACRKEWIPSRRSGKTWLLTWKDAEERWGYRLEE